MLFTQNKKISIPKLFSTYLNVCPSLSGLGYGRSVVLFPSVITLRADVYVNKVYKASSKVEPAWLSQKSRWKNRPSRRVPVRGVSRRSHAPPPPGVKSCPTIKKVVSHFLAFTPAFNFTGKVIGERK